MTNKSHPSNKRNWAKAFFPHKMEDLQSLCWSTIFPDKEIYSFVKLKNFASHLEIKNNFT